MKKLNNFELEQISGGAHIYVYPWPIKIEDNGVLNILIGMGFMGIGIYQLIEHYKKESK